MSNEANLFGTFLDTLNSLEKKQEKSLPIMRSPIAEAIFKQKHAEEYAREVAAREARRAQVNNDRLASQACYEFSFNLESKVLAAIKENKYSISVPIPGNVYDASVKESGYNVHSERHFAPRLTFKTESFNNASPIPDALEALKNDGVNYTIRYHRYGSQSENYEIEYYAVELSW